MNEQARFQEMQQLVDQKITTMMGNQMAYIARLEAQVTVMEKQIRELESQILKDIGEKGSDESFLRAVKK